MNKALLLLVPVLLSSCSAIQHKPVQITPHTVEFHGAKNAISPAASGTPMSEYPSNGQPRATPYEVVFPLSYAVECNAARTACKHAVVQTGLTYEIREVGSEVEITGSLKSTIGRKLTQRVGDQNGSYHQTSLSVSEDVEVIRTGTVIKSFSFTYSPGKRVVVDGFGGVQVIFTFDPLKKPSV